MNTDFEKEALELFKLLNDTEKEIILEILRKTIESDSDDSICSEQI